MGQLVVRFNVISEHLPADKVKTELGRLVKENFLIRNGLKMQGITVNEIEVEEAEVEDDEEDDAE